MHLVTSLKCRIKKEKVKGVFDLVLIFTVTVAHSINNAIMLKASSCKRNNLWSMRVNENFTYMQDTGTLIMSVLVKVSVVALLV